MLTFLLSFQVKDDEQPPRLITVYSLLSILYIYKYMLEPYFSITSTESLLWNTGRTKITPCPLHSVNAASFFHGAPQTCCGAPLSFYSKMSSMRIIPTANQASESNRHWPCPTARPLSAFPHPATGRGNRRREHRGKRFPSSTSQARAPFRMFR